mmetsp:Transcript_13557/g.32837  ORF Transcript_13557/g.32837 Transcript_13557/m.32837 type:complete len:90 (-) Transcript_13557:22-291(-)
MDANLPLSPNWITVQNQEPLRASKLTDTPISDQELLIHFLNKRCFETTGNGALGLEGYSSVEKQWTQINCSELYEVARPATRRTQVPAF